MDKNRAPGAAESRAVNACLTKSHDGPLCGSDYCHQFGKQAEREESVSLAGMGFLESSSCSSHCPLWFGREVRPPFSVKAMTDLSHGGAIWMGVKTISGNSLRPML